MTSPCPAPPVRLRARPSVATRRALLALVVLGVGCRTAAPSAPREEATTGTEPSASAVPAASGSAAVRATPTTPAASGPAPLPEVRAEDGALPWSYPAVPTTAHPGDHVLAPPARWVQNARDGGPASQSFIYFAAKMVAPGPQASILEVAGGALEVLPNALIIPLPPAARAQPGELVLTSWASGTGMQRALVVKGGSPESPRVVYLDVAYDHPSGVGKRAEAIPGGSFRPLTRPEDVGASALCDDEGRRLHVIVVHRAEPQLLGLGFGGRLRAWEAARCRPLPLDPRIEAGTVLVPVLGVFTPARVRHYDEDIGRVFVRYPSGERHEEAAVGIVNVASP